MIQLAAGCHVVTRNGDRYGPLRKSPMWDNMFFSPDGYHWHSDGVLVGFQPGGNLDVVEISNIIPLTLPR